jgi:ferredoxin
MNNPQMAAPVVAHGRPGFYFRVIEEGDIGAGDVIEKIVDGPGRMSVAEIDALLYTSHHPTEALKRALQIPALSPGWSASLQALLNANEKGGAFGNAGLSPVQAGPLLWSGVRTLEVCESRLESQDVRSFTLASEDGSPLPPGLPHASRRPHAPANEQRTGPTVTLTRSALSVRWNPRLNSLLELAEACDVPVRWSCRTGVCHTCETGLIAGNLRYSPEPIDPPAEGRALICCSTPQTDVELNL